MYFVRALHNSFSRAYDERLCEKLNLISFALIKSQYQLHIILYHCIKFINTHNISYSFFYENFITHVCRVIAFDLIFILLYVALTFTFITTAGCILYVLQAHLPVYHLMHTIKYTIALSKVCI